MSNENFPIHCARENSCVAGHERNTKQLAAVTESGFVIELTSDVRDIALPSPSGGTYGSKMSPSSVRNNEADQIVYLKKHCFQLKVQIVCSFVQFVPGS